MIKSKPIRLKFREGNLGVNKPVCTVSFMTEHLCWMGKKFSFLLRFTLLSVSRCHKENTLNTIVTADYCTHYYLLCSVHLLLLLVLSPPGICFPHQQLFKKRRCRCYHVHTPDTHSSCCVSYWKKFMGILLLEWISWHALIWPNSNVMKTEKKGYVTGWNLFVYQLCVCLSGPWERAHSLIMKCTHTCTKVCALSLRQPKQTEKPKWGKN